VPVVKYVRAANYMEAMHKELIEMCRTVCCHDTLELNRNHLLYVKDSHEACLVLAEVTILLSSMPAALCSHFNFDDI